jgi:hypothetical protein
MTETALESTSAVSKKERDGGVSFSRWLDGPSIDSSPQFEPILGSLR